MWHGWTHFVFDSWDANVLSYRIWVNLDDSEIPEAKRIINGIPPLDFFFFDCPKATLMFTSWLRVCPVVNSDEFPKSALKIDLLCSCSVICLQIILLSYLMVFNQKLEPNSSPFEDGPGFLTAMTHRVWYRLCLVTSRAGSYKTFWFEPGCLSGEPLGIQAACFWVDTWRELLL